MARPKTISDHEILHTARKMILEHGPNVSTQQIADALGLSQPALFKRFKTKANLICAALTEPCQMNPLTIIGNEPSADSIEQQLVDIGTQLSQFFDTWIPRLLMLRADGEETFTNAMMNMDNPPPVQTAVAMARWFRQAQAEGRLDIEDPEAVANVYLGGLRSASMLTHMRGQTRSEKDIRKSVGAHVRILYRGIKLAGDK